MLHAAVLKISKTCPQHLKRVVHCTHIVGKIEIKSNQVCL